MCEPIKRKRYPSDLTDAQWEMIEPFVPPVSAEATVPTIERREIIHAILYVLRTGCSWRQMPHDLPNGKTAHHSLRIWTKAGIWEPIMTHLRKQVRTKVGRDPEPSAAIVDSQSINTAPVRGQENRLPSVLWSRGTRRAHQLLLVSDGTQVAQRGVSSLPIVEHFSPLKDGVFGL